MPAFHVTRRLVEVEVSRLEHDGYRITHVVADGPEGLIVFAEQVRRPSAAETRPANPPGPNRTERPDWFVQSDTLGSA